VTLYEQAIGFVFVLIFVSAFVWALMLYARAVRRTRAAIVASSWLLVIVLYWVIFLVLPEDFGRGWIPFMGLGFVFVFAFWGVIDFAIHSDVRPRGGEGARFVQGMALLAFSAVLFVAAYFLPDALDSLPVDVGFGGFFVSILGAAPHRSNPALGPCKAKRLFQSRVANPGCLGLEHTEPCTRLVRFVYIFADVASLVVLGAHAGVFRDTSAWMIRGRADLAALVYVLNHSEISAHRVSPEQAVRGRRLHTPDKAPRPLPRCLRRPQRNRPSSRSPNTRGRSSLGSIDTLDYQREIGFRLRVEGVISEEPKLADDPAILGGKDRISAALRSGDPDALSRALHLPGRGRGTTHRRPALHIQHWMARSSPISSSGS
jgi:hypothetical protein